MAPSCPSYLRAGMPQKKDEGARQPHYLAFLVALIGMLPLRNWWRWSGLESRCDQIDCVRRISHKVERNMPQTCNILFSSNPKPYETAPSSACWWCVQCCIWNASRFCLFCCITPPCLSLMSSAFTPSSDLIGTCFMFWAQNGPWSGSLPERYPVSTAHSACSLAACMSKNNEPICSISPCTGKRSCERKKIKAVLDAVHGLVQIIVQHKCTAMFVTLCWVSALAARAWGWHRIWVKSTQQNTATVPW